MFQKNKKVIPHQYENILKMVHHVPASGGVTHKKQIIFYVLDARGVLSSSTWDRAILGLIVFYVIHLLLLCND